MFSELQHHKLQHCAWKITYGKQQSSEIHLTFQEHSKFLIGNILLSIYYSTKQKAQNSNGSKRAQETPHPCYTPWNPTRLNCFLLSSSLMIDVIWNFCLAVQGHILCHDCSDFRIHVLLQNHQQITDKFIISFICY